LQSSEHWKSFLKFKAPLLSSKQQALEQDLVPELDSPDVEDLTPELEVREIEVPSELHLQRLDVVLTAVLGDFSRNFIQQLIAESCVEKLTLTQPKSHAQHPHVPLVPQFVTKSSAKVHAFERYKLTLKPSAQALAYKPQEMDVDVVYEDDHLRVINKPANWVVHPAPGNWSGTLLNALLFLDPNLTQVPRAGIVHRLDKDTSGLMVVAKTRACMDALVVQIANRDVHREYLAIAHRSWSGPDVKVVESPIGRDPRNRLKMAVVDLQRNSGKSAKTTFTHLGSGQDTLNLDPQSDPPELCLVHCRLHTGRTHQIRVHLSSIGHPILADSVYGGRVHPLIQRQALHAYQLGFDHPITGESLRFKAPLPEDMTSALHSFGLGYNIDTLTDTD
jgi:23S rRNA pseudouridine1911/1915/1917 synthase